MSPTFDLIFVLFLILLLLVAARVKNFNKNEASLSAEVFGYLL